MTISNIITRIEDLPYLKSPPMQITFTQSGSLSAGQYVFNSPREEVGNNKNINDQGLYYIKAMTFSADVELLAYQKAIKLLSGSTDIPTFSLFMQSDSQAPAFIDPIQLSDYFNDQEFKKLILPRQFPNLLTAFFRGTLQQHAGLAGINEINLTINMWMQYVTDDNFIKALQKDYPQVMR